MAVKLRIRLEYQLAFVVRDAGVFSGHAIAPVIMLAIIAHYRKVRDVG